MTDELKPGGDTNTGLPDGWRAPWGWPLQGNVGALWIKPEAATEDDVKELREAGWTAEPQTLIGTYQRLWDAPQYDTVRKEVAALPPCETIPKFGGDGSWTYKSQHLPDRVDKVLCEGKWVYNLDGELVRSKGGEPVEVVDLGSGHLENRQLDIDINWDDELRLWRT